jgi:hypothetical protein
VCVNDIEATPTGHPTNPGEILQVRQRAARPERHRDNPGTRLANAGLRLTCREDLDPVSSPCLLVGHGQCTTFERAT